MEVDSFVTSQAFNDFLSYMLSYQSHLKPMEAVHTTSWYGDLTASLFPSWGI